MKSLWFRSFFGDITKLPMLVRWSIVGQVVLYSVGIMFSVFILESRQRNFEAQRLADVRDHIVKGFETIVISEKEVISGLLKYDSITRTALNRSEQARYRSSITNKHRSLVTYCLMNYTEAQKERAVLSDIYGVDVKEPQYFTGKQWFFTDVSPVPKLETLLLKNLNVSFRLQYINDILRNGQQTLFYVGFKGSPLLSVGNRIDYRTLNAMVFPLNRALEQVDTSTQDERVSLECTGDETTSRTARVLNHDIVLCFYHTNTQAFVGELVVLNIVLIIVLLLMVLFLIKQLRKQSREKLAQHESSMKDFMMWVGHEIRNPLYELQNLDDVNNLPFVTQRIAIVLDNLRTVLQQDNIASLQMHVTHTQTVFNAIKGIYGKARRVNIVLTEEDAGCIYVDLRTIVLIVTNLIDNAIKYSPNGVTRYCQRISGSQMVLEVTDDGSGIDGAYVDRIFEQGFRATNSTHGTGLGLYLVKKYTEIMGGTIRVVTQLGQGSQFIASFPLVREEVVDDVVATSSTMHLPTIEVEVSKSASSCSSNNKVSTNLKILAIDDEVFILEVLKRQLNSYCVETTTDPTKVDDFSKFDVIIVDYCMPKQCGAGVISNIRKQNSGAYVIGLSGNADERTRGEMLSCGANCVLTKPCRRDVLLLEVERQRARVV